MPRCDIAVIGAGPYGLSVAAHLRQAKDIEVRVFGETMSFWREMPMGMLLRSPWDGSNLSDPHRVFTLDGYRHATSNHLTAPLPLERFIEYGCWFQQSAVPDVETCRVECIEMDSAGLQLTLDNGERCKARRVIVAAGIGAFVWKPCEFAALPAFLVSHASEHRDFRRFAGHRVLVIGGGQSALESAALLHESGAEVEILVRAPMVRWLRRHPWLHSSLLGSLLYAPPDVGPAGISHLVARPDVYRRVPRSFQNHLSARSVRPAGAAWLKPRLADVRITTGRTLCSARPARDKLSLKLSDGSERQVDHVLLGTGYRVDISRYSFVHKNLLASIRRAEGSPFLDSGFECSVPGLHFVGAPAAWSFGPLMRFVAGAEFASRNIARRVLGKAAGYFPQYEPCCVPHAA